MRIALLLCVAMLAGSCTVQDEEEEAAAPAGPADRFVFASNRDGDFEIYTMRPDGSDVRQLTRNEETGENEQRDDRPVWSQDGRWITFVSSRDHPRGGAESQEVYVMRSDGSGQRRLTENDDAELLTGWTGDGQIVLWQCSDGISRCELHRTKPSGERGDVVYETENVVVGSSGPFGQEVFARILGRDATTLSGGRQVSIDLETGDIRDRDEEGIPSPDGEELLITTDRDKNGPCLFHDCTGYAPELYADDRRLTHTTGYDVDARWSPDGKRIVFARIANDDRDDYELWVMNADGSCETQLTENEEWDWAPDWVGSPSADEPLDC